MANRQIPRTAWTVITSIALLLTAGCAAKVIETGKTESRKNSTQSAKPYRKTTPPPGTTKPYYVLGKWYHPLTDSYGFRQRGIASWYGDKFHGRKTANGETFDMNRVSAAHKILPLGTWVRVKNRNTGATLDLRINDRGPFVAGRVIDLSKEAAKRLGVYGPGTAPVEVIALPGVPDTSIRFASASRLPAGNPPAGSFSRGSFSFQVGAFRERKNAERLKRQLSKTYRHVRVKPFRQHRTGLRMYRVLIGKTHNLADAERYERILQQRGFRDAFVIAD
jgi:rare lipoprotein A